MAAEIFAVTVSLEWDRAEYRAWLRAIVAPFARLRDALVALVTPDPLACRARLLARATVAEITATIAREQARLLGTSQTADEVAALRCAIVGDRMARA